MSDIRPYINYFDKDLATSNNSTFKLSIQLSNKELSYCLFNIEKNQFTGIVVYKLPELTEDEILCKRIDKIFSNSGILSKKIVSASLIIENNKHTLIPSSLFVKDNIEDYLSFSHSYSDIDIVNYNKILTPDSYNIFAINSLFSKKLSGIFRNLKTFHYSTVLIETLLTRYKNSNTNIQIFADVMDDVFYVAVIKNKELLLCNSYNYNSQEDFIYFLLLVYDQLKLNPEKDKIIFSGKIEKNSKLFQAAYKYIRNIDFMNRDSAYKYSHVLDNITSHQYYNLLNVNLCG